MRNKLAARLRESPRSPTGLIALFTSGLLALAVGVPAAGAKSVTLHYFSETTSSTFVNPAGQSLAPNSKPALGDVIDDTGTTYVGNHRHHATNASGSDHLRCTITSMSSTGPTALCNAQIAIGGSMILGNDETIALSQSAPPIPVNGGTGIYRHAHGLVRPTNIGKNTDFVIKVKY
jgi:hypothetical protein